MIGNIHRIVLLMLYGLGGWFLPTGRIAAHEGKAIFAEQCAHCHGSDGQGGDGYERPLFGEEALVDLIRVVATTMPEDDPTACVGEDARHVAEFILDEFYSEAARIRQGYTKPARIELSRLTVPQYRNAVADLVGAFDKEYKDAGRVFSAPRGLRGEYFESKGMSKANDRKFERVDVEIAFDFEQSAPRDDIAADQFAIVWEGSVIADETGYHEFRVGTSNGVRLYVNNDPPETRRKLRDDSSVAGQAALIDAWVSSGTLREHTARVFLLGGRAYPIRLEFFKYKEPTASVKLEWKPPHGVWSTPDRRHLRTRVAARTFVVDTPFPADDRSLGYEWGSSISKEWHEATNQGAVATAEEVVARLPRLTSGKRGESLHEFVTSFARIAYRRPLTEKEEQHFEAIFRAADSEEIAAHRALLRILSSPQFLYVDLTPDGELPSSYAVVSRLAFILWDSLPDTQLQTVAHRQELDRSVLKTEAKRMLSDPRARAKISGFFHQWLELGERDLAKDRALFPQFDGAVIADLRYSLLQFLADVVWSERSDYRELLTADYLLLNPRLRAFYRFGSPQTPLSYFERVAAPQGRRAGVLTHPYLLSALAYHNSTSPIHRGVFVTRNVMGRSLKPPPIAVAFKGDEFSPDLSMREKITQLTRDRACMSCHAVVNPLGFALENYDAVGRWRAEENGRPVNTASAYVTQHGEKLEVKNATDIANYAIESVAAQRAFVSQLFTHLVKQNPSAYQTVSLKVLREGFAADDFHIQNLMARIAVAAASEGLFTESESP